MLKLFDHRRANERPVAPFISARRACHVVRRPARAVVGRALAKDTTVWFGRTNRPRYDLRSIMQFALHGSDMVLDGPVAISLLGVDAEIGALRLSRPIEPKHTQSILTYLEIFLRQSGQLHAAWFRHRDSWERHDGMILIATHPVMSGEEGDDLRMFVFQGPPAGG